MWKDYLSVFDTEHSQLWHRCGQHSQCALSDGRLIEAQLTQRWRSRLQVQQQTRVAHFSLIQSQKRQTAQSWDQTEKSMMLCYCYGSALENTVSPVMCCKQLSVSLLQDDRLRCCSLERLDKTERPASEKWWTEKWWSKRTLKAIYSSAEIQICHILL